MEMLPNAVIVTGRPSSDRFVTNWWLRRVLGFQPPVVYARRFQHSTVKVAEYKASVVRMLDLVEFVESDDAQAEMIQKLAPKCKTYTPKVWGSGKGKSD